MAVRFVTGVLQEVATAIAVLFGLFDDTLAPFDSATLPF
jgi:hypothetical protein